MYTIIILTVFQSNGHWDCTARVHPELETLYKEYEATEGTYFKKTILCKKESYICIQICLWRGNFICKQANIGKSNYKVSEL